MQAVLADTLLLYYLFYPEDANLLVILKLS